MLSDESSLHALQNLRSFNASTAERLFAVVQRLHLLPKKWHTGDYWRATYAINDLARRVAKRRAKLCTAARIERRRKKREQRCAARP